MNNLELQLAKIEAANTSLDDRDGPELIMSAVLAMLAVDPTATEAALVGKLERESDLSRLKYLSALKYFLSYAGNVLGSTVDFLVNIASNDANHLLRDAATVALAWNQFENVDEISFDSVYHFLKGSAHKVSPDLSVDTFQLVSASLKEFERRKRVLHELNEGQIVISKSFVENLLLRESLYTFSKLGFNHTNQNRLVRILAWTSPSINMLAGKYKARKPDQVDVGAIILGPRGLPHATIKVAWHRDFRNNIFTILDASVEN